MKLVAAVAGLRVALDADAAQWDRLAPRYAPFAVDGAPDLSVTLRSDATLALDVGVEYPGARAVCDGARYRIDRRDFSAVLDLDAGTLDVRARPSLAAEAALRVAVSLLLPRRGGLILHSSGVVEDGVGHVFSGRSGIGKTTTVRRLAPRVPLGDDLVALVADGSGFRAVATPFAGEYGTVAPASAPLARLYFLAQAPSTRMTPLAEADARRHVLKNALAYARDADTAGHLLDVAARLARAVPCFALDLARDGDPADVVFATRAAPGSPAESAPGARRG